MTADPPGRHMPRRVSNRHTSHPRRSASIIFPTKNLKTIGRDRFSFYTRIIHKSLTHFRCSVSTKPLTKITIYDSLKSVVVDKSTTCRPAHEAPLWEEEMSTTSAELIETVDDVKFAPGMSITCAPNGTTTIVDPCHDTATYTDEVTFAVKSDKPFAIFVNGQLVNDRGKVICTTRLVYTVKGGRIKLEAKDASWARPYVVCAWRITIRPSEWGGAEQQAA